MTDIVWSAAELEALERMATAIGAPLGRVRRAAESLRSTKDPDAIRDLARKMVDAEKIEKLLAAGPPPPQTDNRGQPLCLTCYVPEPSAQLIHEPAYWRWVRRCGSDCPCEHHKHEIWLA
jgi:hypothetical protein